MEIKRARIDKVTIEREENGECKVSGMFSLINERGIIVAKQPFNGYNELKIGFGDFGKNVVSDIEATVELELGIVERVTKEIPI